LNEGLDGREGDQIDLCLFCEPKGARLSFFCSPRLLANVFAQSSVSPDQAGVVSNLPAPPPRVKEQVDQLFTKWDKVETPGAAIAIIKDGKIIYSRGYGMANLEYDIPNTPATVFHIASVSKQFTAFAIYLLERENKLSLDDDVRRYLPELHDFGKAITIRQLLHHTSGLRDQWNLLALAGWRLEDVITQQDVLGLIWRQKELNFAPGEQMLYSNTGYTLLGLIVERVSGTSLSKFTQERIFQPLGMTHTHFQDDYGSLVKNRAYSYYTQEGGYKYIALSYSTVGPTSLFTTVEDLARWDQNFYDGRVGGEMVLDKMQAKGQLNNGRDINYASGLVIDEYRGLSSRA
jgi:CubicO group peptidase (beta-lactamase class C family)